MENATFFESGVSVLDMVYDTLVGDKTEQTLYRTSINGAPTAILLTEFLDSTIAVGKCGNMSFMATQVEGRTHIYYNRENDVIVRNAEPKNVSAFLLDKKTVKMVFTPGKEIFIEKLTQSVLA